MTEQMAEPCVLLSSEALDPASENLIAKRVSKDSDRLRQLLESRIVQHMSDKGVALRHAYALLAPQDLRDLVRNPFYSFWWRQLMGQLARKDTAGATTWLPELSRLLSAALFEAEPDFVLDCRTDANGTLALPTLRCALIGLEPAAPVALHTTSDGELRVQQGNAEFGVALDALRGQKAHPKLRRYCLIPGSNIALDASDPWVTRHLSALNAEPAEHPYPKRDLAADTASHKRILSHYGLGMHLVDQVWAALGHEIRDDISYVFPFSSALILGWADLRFRGGIFINSRPDDLVFYIERLVHEAAHIRLFATDQVALHTDPPTRRISSPFRRDARPVTGLIHAAFVYARLIDLFVRLDSKAVPGFGARVIETTPKFRDCAEALLTQASLTSSGRHLVEDLRARVQGVTDR